MRGRYTARDVFWAWLAATVFSGIPSTVIRTATGQDLWVPVRAVGLILVPADAPAWMLFVAAAFVHSAVSLLWTLVIASVVPTARAPLYAVAASALIGVLDLRILSPVLFPEVAALEFLPQFADHLMWGLLVGVTLKLRAEKRQSERA